MSKLHLFLHPDYFILGDICGIRLVLYENLTLCTIGVSKKAKSQPQETFTYV